MVQVPLVPTLELGNEVKAWEINPSLVLLLFY